MCVSVCVCVYIYKTLLLILTDVWQRPPYHCKAIILQLKKKILHHSHVHLTLKTAGLDTNKAESRAPFL